jgi:hypothetical protein
VFPSGMTYSDSPVAHSYGSVPSALPSWERARE